MREYGDRRNPSEQEVRCQNEITRGRSNLLRMVNRYEFYIDLKDNPEVLAQNTPIILGYQPEEIASIVQRSIVDGRFNIRHFEELKAASLPEEERNQHIERMVRDEYQVIANNFFIARLTPQEEEEEGFLARFQNILTPEDYHSIKEIFLQKLTSTVRRLPQDHAWLESWRQIYPGLPWPEEMAAPAAAVTPIRPERRRENIQEQEQTESRLRAFLISQKNAWPAYVAGFIGGAAAREITRQFARSFLMGYSGAAIVGAVGGLVAGAGAEYVKQIQANLREQKTESQNYLRQVYDSLPPNLRPAEFDLFDLMVDTRRRTLKEKLKVLKVRDRKKLAYSALRGAATGVLGGLLVEGIHQLIEASNAPAASSENQAPTATESPQPGTTVAPVSELTTVPTATPEPATALPAAETVPTSYPPSTPQPHLPETLPSAPPAEVHPEFPVPEPSLPETFTQVPSFNVDSLIGGSVEIPLGSTPSEQIALLLEKILGYPPSEEQIMIATKGFCEANKIAVPEWGLRGVGWISDRAIQAGSHFQINAEVVAAIKQAIAKN